MPAHFQVEPEMGGKRLDVFLAESMERVTGLRGLSRTRIQELIREGHLEIDGKPVTKPNHRLLGGEGLFLELPEPEPLELAAEPIPLEIVYQDEHLALIDKPAGLVVHPSGRTRQGTLVNALLYHLKDLSGIGGKLRPGIVHRLDKGTSGLILVAKHDEAHLKLTAAFKNRSIHKTYLALALGEFTRLSGRIDFAISRHRTQRHKMVALSENIRIHESDDSPRRKIKPAVTRFEVLKQWPHHTLAALSPETGRTHQIRVHLAQIGHPVVGDFTYGYQHRKIHRVPHRLVDELNGPALHAWKLDFEHPVTGEQLRFETAVPLRIQNFIDYFEEMG